MDIDDCRRAIIICFLPFFALHRTLCASSSDCPLRHVSCFSLMRCMTAKNSPRDFQISKNCAQECITLCMSASPADRDHSRWDYASKSLRGHFSLRCIAFGHGLLIVDALIMCARAAWVNPVKIGFCRVLGNVNPDRLRKRAWIPLYRVTT